MWLSHCFPSPSVEWEREQLPPSGMLCTRKSKQANEVQNFENRTELWNSGLSSVLPENGGEAAYGKGVLMGRTFLIRGLIVLVMCGNDFSTVMKESKIKGRKDCLLGES